MRSLVTVMVGLAALSLGCSGRDRGMPLDSGTPMDGAPTDSAPDGPNDAGDTSIADTAVADTAVADTAIADTAIADTAVADTAVADTAVADSAVADTGAPAMHTVFASSEILSANLGGLSGADATCQRLAGAAGLTGTYRAILSDAAQNARDRLGLVSEVRDTAGTIIAGTATELWSGGIRARIAVDENAASVTTSIIWTGTDADGVADRSGGFCGNWTSSSGGAEAGRTDRMDDRWISIYGDGGSAHACSNTSRIYCISID